MCVNNNVCSDFLVQFQLGSCMEYHGCIKVEE